MRTGLLITTCASLVVLTGQFAMADRAIGVDVSVWQGSINWTAVRNSGRTFAFVKASQGTTIVDSWFSTNIVNAPAAGVYAGCYHFADPTNTYQPPDSHTALDEANWFVDHAGNRMVAGYIRPVLDLEQGSALGKTGLSNWANTFCNRVLARTGVRPIIYTGGNFARNYLDSSVAQWDLWFAYPDNPPSYYYDPQTDNPPTYWLGIWSPNWMFWQYSWEGQVPGVSGNCDLDVFNGTLSEFLQVALIGGTPSEITRSPATLAPVADIGRNPANQSFTIRNSASGTLNYTITSDAAWMTVSPATGTSTGETDTITVSYSVAGLDIGTYPGTLRITAMGASNSPQIIDVTLKVAAPGDLDADGDIDVLDVTILDDCRLGPSTPNTNPDCIRADLYHDSDVDQSDFGLLQKCLTGAAGVADPNCAIP